MPSNQPGQAGNTDVKIDMKCTASTVVVWQVQFAFHERNFFTKINSKAQHHDHIHHVRAGSCTHVLRDLGIVELTFLIDSWLKSVPDLAQIHQTIRS